MNTRSRLLLTNRAILAAVILVSAGCTQRAVDTNKQIYGASGPGAPVKNSVAQILQERPEFSDFTTVIKFAGLWHELDASNGLTILAPTNLAFDRSDPDWRAHLFPKIASQGNATAMRRQSLVETAEIAGIHPPSDFMGKIQDVQSVGGRVLHLDGRTPGVLKVTTGPVPVARFGVTASVPTGDVKLPPIQGANGLVYSIDAITVYDQN